MKRREKNKIKAWDGMVSKIKGKFFPINYSLNFFKKLQNLSQKEVIMKKYTNFFYKLSIRSKQSDEGDEVDGRYINGLHMIFHTS